MASGYIFFCLLGVSFLLQVSGYGTYGSFGGGSGSRTIPNGYPGHHFHPNHRPPHGGGCGGGHRPPGKPFPTHRPHPTFPTFPTTTSSATTKDPLPPTPTPSIEGTQSPLLPTPEPEFEGFPNLRPAVRPSPGDRRSRVTSSTGVRPAQRPIQENTAASAYQPPNRPIMLPANISGRHPSPRMLPANISGRQASPRMVPGLDQGSKDETWLRPAPRPRSDREEIRFPSRK